MTLEKMVGVIVEVTASEVYLPDLNESEFSLEDSTRVDTERDEKRTFSYDDISGAGDNMSDNKTTRIVHNKRIVSICKKCDRQYTSDALCVNDDKQCGKSPKILFICIILSIQQYLIITYSL